jgi:ubiquinone/menaquinone biosynthesis C-methylase UbiE
MSKDDVEKLAAVMRSYERKSKLAHYDMWSRASRSHSFKAEEFKLVSDEIPATSNSDLLALDAGCGYGVYSSMLVGKGYTVVALDASTGMLRKARQLASDGQISFVRGSITHLPFRKDRFRVLLCLDTLHHFTDSFLDEALDEFRRIIKSEGQLVTDMRNVLNPLVSLQYSISNRKWAQVGGLTLKARSLSRMGKRMNQKGFWIKKSRGIGLGFSLFAPYIVIFSRAARTE